MSRGVPLPDEGDDKSDDHRKPDDSIKKYLWGCVIVFSVLALPHSRFQDLFKMAVWTVIVLGVYTPIVWPSVRDKLSVIVLLSVYLSHFLVMYVAYPHIPHDDYIFIGIITVLEGVVFSVPAGWLIVRARRNGDNSSH